MPLEPLKEVVQTPGFFGAVIDVLKWFFGIIGAGVVVMWGGLTGRIKKLEETSASTQILRDHIEDENRKFDALFDNHKDQSEKISKIAESVARIEGVLSK